MAKKSKPKVKISPIDLNISFHDTYTPKELIQLIRDVCESVPKGAKNLQIEFEEDYGGCYYEGDRPSLKVSLKYDI